MGWKPYWPALHNSSHKFSLPPQCFNAVRKSAFNLAFLRLQPKKTKIQIIQQGKKNESKWKEARHIQTKNWLIMLNRLPEDKE